MSEKIIVRNQNEVYLRIDCPPGISQELWEHFSFKIPNARFHPLVKKKKWNGVKHLYNKQNRLLYRGLADSLRRFSEDSGYELLMEEQGKNNLSIDEARFFFNELNLSGIDERDYQIEAFQNAINDVRSISLNPTGSGKSALLYMIIRYLLSKDYKKLCIIVPRVQLVHQLYKDFESYSENNGWNISDNCHRIWSGEDKDTTKPITITTWQSLANLPRNYFWQFDGILLDECHLGEADVLTHILSNMINAKFRLGVSGTLADSLTHKMVLTGLFGPIRKIISTKELIDKGVLADLSINALLIKHPESVCKEMKKMDYRSELEYLIGCKKRNSIITNLAISLQGNTLILFERVENHGKILYDILSEKIEKDRKCFFIHGKIDVEIREEIRAIVEKETNAIIVASFGTTSLGTNIKNLHNAIFASPSKSRIRNLQSIGRILRKSDTKSKATLWDIGDDMSHKNRLNFTLKHYVMRLRIYAEEELKFRIHKISL